MKSLTILILLACLCGCGKQEPFVLRAPSGTNQFSITISNATAVDLTVTFPHSEWFNLQSNIASGMFKALTNKDGSVSVFEPEKLQKSLNNLKASWDQFESNPTRRDMVKCKLLGWFYEKARHSNMDTRKRMKPHFLLLLCLCGCVSTIRHNQDVKWNSDYSWVNWPTNALIPPKPKTIAKRVQAQAVALPRTTVLWRWNDTNTPPVSYRLYSSPDASPRT